MSNKHKSLLCVGGPRAGQRYATPSGSGFRVPVAEPAPSDDAIDYMPNAAVKVEFTNYRAELFHTPQGDVEFWVPADQTPLTTITLLLEAYEAIHRRPSFTRRSTDSP